MRAKSGARAILLAALTLAQGALAGDDKLQIQELGLRDGVLMARVALIDGFDEETRSSIARGLPITVRYTSELWRKRRLWWDKQLASRVRLFRVRYDPGEKLYEVAAGDPRRPPETFESLDAALAGLSTHSLAVHPADELQERHRYYVTVELAIQPLTVEEFRELDGWISGRLRGDEGAGHPDETPQDEGGGVSGAFFGFLIDLAGFGDKILEAETAPFRPSELHTLEAP